MIGPFRHSLPYFLKRLSFSFTRLYLLLLHVSFDGPIEHMVILEPSLDEKRPEDFPEIRGIGLVLEL